MQSISLPLTRMSVDEDGNIKAVDVSVVETQVGLRAARAADFTADGTEAKYISILMNSGTSVPAGEYQWEVSRDELFVLQHLVLKLKIQLISKFGQHQKLLIQRGYL